MKHLRNRPGRKYRRWLALLPIVAATLAILPTGAEAGTGGASPTASSGADLSFSAFRSAGATWYGPGLYGRRTACGQILQPQTVGVANRELACGTSVKFVYRGHALVTRVIDRGPYRRSSDWDLTNGARRALGFEGSDRIRYAIAISYARAERSGAGR